MTTTNHPGNKLNDSPAAEVAHSENGDLYDEETGKYYCTLDLKQYEPTMENPIPLETIPAQICLFFNGRWYVYKIDSSYKEEGEE